MQIRHTLTFPCFLFLGAVMLSGCLGNHVETFDSGGQTLAYTTRGEGPTLVLVHGFQGTAASHWDFPGTIDRLARDFRVVALDCRGHGRSSKPTSPEDYGQAMVDDVANLLDHLGEERVYLAGFSMGAWISLKFAATNPERVQALAIAGGGWREFDGKSLAQLVNDLLVPLLHRDYDPEAFSACSEAFPGFQLDADEVRALPAPLLLVVGSEDGAVPGVERLAAARPHAELLLLDGVDHNGTVFAGAFRENLHRFMMDAANNADDNRESN